MLKLLQKLFGGKKDQDVSELMPYLQQVKAEEAQLQGLTDDQLRAQTPQLQEAIRLGLEPWTTALDNVQQQVRQLLAQGNMQGLEELFTQQDQLLLERNKELEKVLLRIMPRAFAVVRETCRRLATNKQLVVAATEHDHDFVRRNRHRKLQPVTFEGDKAIWKNQWEAAGNMVTWDMVHYDVQLIGGMVLHMGKIAEMATGEGKTLVATLPAYLNGLAGFGVHIVTVNDYLARRDMEWNGPIFEFHGLRVECIDLHEPNTAQRREAYHQAAITYGTNNEFGFDYLRDNMVHSAEHLVQRRHHYAIVDEIDSVLIDEARTPLIISGPVPRGDQHEFSALKPRIERLINEQKRIVQRELQEGRQLMQSGDSKKAGERLFRAYRGLPKYGALVKYLSEEGVKSTMLKSEAYYLQDKGKNMHLIDDELYFTIDEKNRDIELTDKGRELITLQGEDPNLFVLPDIGAELAQLAQNHQMSADDKARARERISREYAEKSERLHSLQQLLKAYTLFDRDVEYIVQDGKVMIVDEGTGRVLPGRRYSDGLHQAIEAKENVKVEAATQTYATITLQNFFRMYHKLAGMTGTAQTEAAEFFEIYKLEVVSIPTNRPVVRVDEDDRVYKTKREKFNAIMAEVEKLRNAGRPVLVGTTNVEVSEQLSRSLRLAKVPHEVLNAKQHEREAEIVALAGQAPNGVGNVTIATNMAGRGTDIKLGPGVREAGGLAIIGSERHESRRIDLQLRGRAGRQGDPGSSHFFVSLEDDLMRLFGSERIAKVMDMMKVPEGEMIQHRIISRSIANAQRKVEENNFGVRKRLLEYDDVMNKQREVVYTQRRNALFGDRMLIDLDNMLQDFCQNLAEQFAGTTEVEELQMEVAKLFAQGLEVTARQLEEMEAEDLAQHLYALVRNSLDARNTHLAAVVFDDLSRQAQAAKPGMTPEEYQQKVLDAYLMFDLTDGHRVLRFYCRVGDILESQGRALVEQFMRSAVLSVIDDRWKEHLRAMDDLKQEVHMASFEQKDPLLIYKTEGYNLFMANLEAMRREILGLLLKAGLRGQQEAKAQAAHQRTDQSRLRARHDDVERETRAAVPRVGPQRPVSRRERREMERQQQKRKK